jgi:hypothetical protein
MIKNALLLIAGMLVFFVVVGVITGGPASQSAQAQPRGSGPERSVARRDGSDDLHGLATIELPKGWKSLGLAEVIGASHDMSASERLARHADRHAAVFRFARDQHNSMGGHARDPELLNVVLLNPVERTTTPLRGFSIERYYSPMAGTIPLDDPRWKSAQDGRFSWRWLEMNDHFGTDNAPRWAMVMYDAEKHVRLDLFVWRKRYSYDKALAFLRDRMASIRITSALHAHFSQAGTYEERIASLREANIERFLEALVPLQVPSPASDGGVAFGPSTAAWVDGDRKALRVLRLIGQVPLDDRVVRDKHGRPELLLHLKPGQYPGPTRSAVPSLYLGMLYWNPDTQRWHRSMLQSATAEEHHPLVPFEESVCAALPDTRSVYLVLSRHYYQPYALDDSRDIDAFLADAAFWSGELAAGKIVARAVLPATFANTTPREE